MVLVKVIYLLPCSVIAAIVLTLYAVPIFSGDYEFFGTITIEPIAVAKIAVIVGLIHGMICGFLIMLRKIRKLFRSVLISMATTAVMLSVVVPILVILDIVYWKSSLGMTPLNLASIMVIAFYTISVIVTGSIIFLIPSITIGTVAGWLSKRLFSPREINSEY